MPFPIARHKYPPAQTMAAYLRQLYRRKPNIINLEDALNYAEQDIKDRWEFYKERYLKKIK